jgi:muramidase (phage lysozyme)
MSAADPQSFNRYAYTQNDPVNFTDPSGLFELNTGYFDAMRSLLELFLHSLDVGGAPQPLPYVDPGDVGEPPPPPNTTPDEITLQTLKNNCAIGAMLDAIAHAEGNPAYGTVVRGKVTKSPNDPSLVGQRDVVITDFSRHPGITVQVNKNLYSTAAGRYQIKASTWASLELSDFSPASQDEGARILMGRRGMIEPLLAGDFAKAVEKGNQEWASLPGSPYGQPTKTLDKLKGVYDQSYNTCVRKVFGGSP